MPDDVIGIWNRVFEPLGDLSSFYEEASARLGKAIEVNLETGAATVDGDTLHAASKQFLSVDLEDRVSRVVSGLQLGFAVRDRQILAPWFSFIDPELTSQLDTSAWRALGVEPGSRPGALMDALTDRYPNVPDPVLDPKNLRQLVQASRLADFRAKSVEAFQAGSQVALASRDADDSGRFAGGDLAGSGTSRPHSGWSGVGSMVSGITPVPSDYEKAAECFLSAQWSYETTPLEIGPFVVSGAHVVSICMEKACADVLESVLLSGAGGVFAAGVAALLKVGVSMSLNAFVAGAGGWVSVGVAASALYWGAMIHWNKTARGVCLKIPPPWTLGAIGPGWAVGRR